MAFVVVVVVIVGSGGIIAYVKLMDRAMEKYAVGAADVLLLLVGAGILFAAGFFTARYGLGMAVRQSLLVGMVVPAAYAAGRLSWVALGLPTPWSDYERWRDQDHRDYWN
ncbi:hypothetical protein [Streptomyces sp. HGB0020]|uniref:hypothetical protein n=1 Tax=Streptomyces sp. HGB0020 TaxID=1078086 RepID=UPI00034EA3F4|nr:hypothetical protein [Streptomyces sp. HGB0020]EPD62492.1 hypothetical protein HMPREF1211_04126 [Streptomyces sp. HGB0020]